MKTLLSFLACLLAFNPLTASHHADYVIVGVGTAGAVLAKQLSDDLQTSVFAIHGGKDLNDNPDIKFTKNAFFTVISALFGSPYYQTGNSTPQSNADNRELFIALALPEGGASAINAGAWCRGTTQVYSQWEAIAGPAWSVARIQQIYKDLETYNGTTPNPEFRGFNGPINIRQSTPITTVGAKFTNAIALGTNVPIIEDYNDPLTPIGVCPQVQYTQKGKNGALRVSSATAFLNRNVVTHDGKGVDGRKLRIKFKSYALKTIWEGNKAVGVEYFHKGCVKKAYAKKGVIVCGGLKSSAFLMHSGIGPKKVLEPLDICVKFDNPNVGQGLADQPQVVIAFATNPADTPIESRHNKSCTWCDFLTSKQTLIDKILCGHIQFPSNSIFSQIAWLPAPFGDPLVRQLRFAAVNPIPGLALCFFDLVQPKSRGSITIKSANPFTLPVIDVGEFTNTSDLDLYTISFQTYIKNINIALQSIDEQYQLIFPNPEILDNLDQLTAFIKEEVGSNQCWQSHCRMAPLEQGGVVNSQGQVYGVQNLYVADDSIVPVGMDGTPMASAYLIAANIAQMLLNN